MAATKMPTEAANYGPLAIFLQRKSKKPSGPTDSTWKGERGALPSYLDVVERDLGVTFPAEYRNLLLFSNGGHFFGVTDRIFFFDAAFVSTMKRDRATYKHEFLDRFTHPPFVFATNSQDGDFLFDPGDALGAGSWAVWVRTWADGGARVAGKTLLEVVERIDAGERCAAAPATVSMPA